MSYPYIPARRHGGRQAKVDRIVIHCTVSPTVRGGARAVAGYFRRTSRDASAHFVVDPGQVVQCLREGTVGYHAPPNAGSIGIELCDPQQGSASRWSDAAHQAMLRRAARLIREVARRHDIPIRRLSPSDLLAGRRGICGHADVAKAWHQTDHTDPGTGFPWTHLLDLVSREDDVPEYVSVKIEQPQQVPAGAWHTVAWPVEVSDKKGQHGGDGLSVLTGRATYALDVSMRITGLPVGTLVQARAVEVAPDPDEPDTIAEPGPVTEFVTSRDGEAPIHYALPAGLVDAGRLVRVQVAQHGAAPATIVGGDLKLTFWRN